MCHSGLVQLLILHTEDQKEGTCPVLPPSSWLAGLSPFASPHCLLRIQTESFQCHNHVTSDYPEQTWPLTSSARTSTATQTLHLIQCLIMTTRECPRITQKMWNKVHGHWVLLKELSLWQQSTQGSEPHAADRVSPGLSVVQFHVWLLVETENKHHALLQRSSFTYCLLNYMELHWIWFLFLVFMFLPSPFWASVSLRRLF